MKRGILVKRINEGKEIEVQLVDIKSEDTRLQLQEIYDLLNVDLIDVVFYKGMSIYVDDEGLLKSNPKLTMYLSNTNQRLYGNVLILGGVNDEGETLGMTVKDAITLNKSLKWGYDMKYGEVLVW